MRELQAVRNNTFDTKEEEEKMLIPPAKMGRPTKKPDIYTFAADYPNMTAAELGKKYGVSDKTVYRWAKEFRQEEAEKVQAAGK